MSSEEAKYTIEATVGQEVAGKLMPGGVVRIGKNGKLLHGEQIPTSKHEFDIK